MSLQEELDRAIASDQTPCEDCEHWPLGVCSMAGEKQFPCKSFARKTK